MCVGDSGVACCNSLGAGISFMNFFRHLTCRCVILNVSVFFFAELVCVFSEIETWCSVDTG